MSAARPARPPLAGVPPALVIAIATMLIAGITLELITTYASTEVENFRGDGWLARFVTVGRGLLYKGTSIATSALVLVGMIDLARRGCIWLRRRRWRLSAADIFISKNRCDRMP